MKVSEMLNVAELPSNQFSFERLLEYLIDQSQKKVLTAQDFSYTFAKLVSLF